MAKSEENLACPVSVETHTSAQLIEGLVVRYGVALSRFFERRVARPSEVPDLVQEVFLRLSKVKDPAAVAQPESYLFKTAMSALQDQNRRDRARQRDFHEEFSETAHGGTDFSPERVLMGREEIRCVEAALNQLPERTRDIFLLRAFEDRRIVEVARAMGISRRAAEKHYSRALAHLAKALARYDHD